MESYLHLENFQEFMSVNLCFCPVSQCNSINSAQDSFYRRDQNGRKQVGIHCDVLAESEPAIPNVRDASAQDGKNGDWAG